MSVAEQVKSKPTSGAGADAPATAPAELDPSTAMRWLLATLSFGAGAVHLAMVPQHAQESLRMGLAFAAAGWFQIAFGAAVLARPSRFWVQLAIVANLAFLAAWTVSRTVGLPPWTGGGGVEEVSSPDLLCANLEAVTVIGCLALLIAPGLLQQLGRRALTVATVIPVGILVATTAVLASPSTANHVHAGGSEAGHSHAISGAEATGGHVHTDSAVTYDELPPATRAEVDQVITAYARKYPTGADAARDGWFKATKSLYGIGAHYVKGNSLSIASPFDMLHPNILLFDGEGPDAKFAGVSYVVGGERPEGFTGDYDTWHSHTSVCLQGGTVISLSEDDSPVWLSESDCTVRGGRVLPLGSDLMMHLWIGPGYMDGTPIFAHDNPKLYDGYNPQRDA
jgi:hypothetical protein